MNRVTSLLKGSKVCTALLLLAGPCFILNSVGAKETNVYGLPTTGKDGDKINYTQSELNLNAPAALPAAQSTVQSARAAGLTVPEFRPTWSHSLFASGVGLNLWAGPSDSGQSEIYVGSSKNMFGGNDFWACLQYDNASKTYMPIFASEYFQAKIKTITVGNVIGGPGKEIIVASEDGRIVIYDQVTKAIVHTINVPDSIFALRTANLNGGSTDDIIICNFYYTAVFSGTSLQWFLPVGGTALAVGQMDDDPAMEIAVSSGKVIDSATRTVQWDRGAIFGTHLEAADIDHDGRAELIASEAWTYVRAFDVDMGIPKWTYQTAAGIDVTALAITDVDADGSPEVAIGDGQWGKVTGIDPITLAVKYSIPNPKSGVAGIAAADVDSDGMTEVIWGGGFQSSGNDLLCVSNPATAATEWQSPHLDGPVIGPLIGDLDGDKRDELVIATQRSDEGSGYGRILVFDNATLKLRAISPSGVSSYGYIHDLKLYDVDNDGKLEIITAGQKEYTSLIETYKFNANNTFTLAWTKYGESGESSYWHVDAGDVDSDGEIELLVSSYSDVQVIDYKTKVIEWKSFDMQAPGWDGVGDVAMTDLDTTPGLEIIAQMEKGSAFIFDGKTHAPRQSLTGPFSAMQVDGKKLYLCTTSGLLKIYAFANGKYTVVSQVQLADGQIDGFNVIDGAAGIFTFGKDGRLHVYADGQVRSRSADYAAPYGRQLAGNATAGQYSVSVYRDHQAPVLFAEPQTTPGTSNLIQWAYAPGAVSYTVQAAASSDFASDVVSTRVFTPEHEFLGLTIDTTYYYRVKASFLDRNIESAWSETVSSTQVTAPASAGDWNLYN